MAFYYIIKNHVKFGIRHFVGQEDFNIIIIIITSSSDLQPSTAIANQLPGQLVYIYTNYN